MVWGKGEKSGVRAHSFVKWLTEVINPVGCKIMGPFRLWRKRLLVSLWVYRAMPLAGSLFMT